MENISKAVKKKKIIDYTPYNAVKYANFFFKNNAIELVNCSIDYLISCSQYSIHIKDIEMLNSQILSMFFDRVLVSPVFKKDPKLEHRCYNYDDQFDDDED